MNAWKRFQKLAGGYSLRVGEVVAVYGQETVLADNGGNRFRATGTGVALGHMAYVQDGVVIGEAPALVDVGIQWV